MPQLRPHALAYVASVPAGVLDRLRTPRCWRAAGLLPGPELYREAAKALAARRAPAAQGAGRADGTELALALYLLRAITKIAAYSTFTAAARTGWSPEGPALAIAGAGLRQRRVASLNHLP